LNGKIKDGLDVEGDWTGGGSYILKLERLEDEYGVPNLRFAYLIKPKGAKHWNWASKREPTVTFDFFKELIVKGLKEKEWVREILFEALKEAGIQE
jgi:hypothetical protein